MSFLVQNVEPSVLQQRVHAYNCAFPSTRSTDLLAFPLSFVQSGVPLESSTSTAACICAKSHACLSDSQIMVQMCQTSWTAAAPANLAAKQAANLGKTAWSPAVGCYARSGRGTCMMTARPT
eukprot:4857446-Amphidinium_carterae.1